MLGANYKLAFSSNWNNKLNAYCFTTIRLKGLRHEVGTLFDVYLNNDLVGEAIVNFVETVKLDQITPRMAFLDTGYNAETTKNILRTMYKNNASVEIDRCELSVLTLSWQGEPPTVDKIPKRKKLNNHPINQAQ